MDQAKFSSESAWIPIGRKSAFARQKIFEVKKKKKSCIKKYF